MNNTSTGFDRGNSGGGADAAARTGGFSLIELMVVLGIMAVLLGVAAPAFVTTVKNNRMLTEVYALRATLADARSEAMARRMAVVVCESTDGTSCAADPNAWSAGYLAYADTNSDGVPDPNEIFSARQVDAPELSILFTRSGTATSGTGFSARGDSLNNDGTFTFCDDRGASNAAAILLRASGDARIAGDSDSPEDGIVNDLGGGNVSC